jgi:hypothetical protein
MFVSPSLLSIGMKNDDPNATTADYGLRKTFNLGRAFSEVYLKAIRFAIIVKAGEGHPVFQPYQFHLRWMNGQRIPEQEAIVLGNTMSHEQSGDKAGLLKTEVPDNVIPSYSTFCTCRFVYRFKEPLSSDAQGSQIYDDFNDFFYYEMERDDLIYEGTLGEMNFEVFFTNLAGKRIYRYIPTVELDFELM